MRVKEFAGEVQHFVEDINEGMEGAGLIGKYEVDFSFRKAATTTNTELRASFKLFFRFPVSDPSVTELDRCPLCGQPAKVVVKESPADEGTQDAL